MLMDSELYDLPPSLKQMDALGHGVPTGLVYIQQMDTDWMDPSGSGGHPPLNPR